MKQKNNNDKNLIYLQLLWETQYISWTNESKRKELSKDVENLNSTINKFDPLDLNRPLTQYIIDF